MQGREKEQKNDVVSKGKQQSQMKGKKKEVNGKAVKKNEVVEKKKSKRKKIPVSSSYSYRYFLKCVALDLCAFGLIRKPKETTSNG